MTSFKPKDNKYHGHAHDSLRIYLFNSAFLASKKYISRIYLYIGTLTD